MRKLSVGYLVDDRYQPNHVYDLIEKSKSARHYSIDYLIVQTIAADKNLLKKAYRFLKNHSLIKFAVTACFKVILGLEHRALVRDPRLKSAFDRYHLDTFQVSKVHVQPLESTSECVYREQDLETIKSLNIDVLLNGQSAILRGGILDVCEFGIISLHYGTSDATKQVPPGFWEVLNRAPSTGFEIKRLPNEVTGGAVLMRGCIGTKPSCAQNFAQIYKKPNIFLHRMLENLGETRILPQTLPEAPDADAPEIRPSLGVIALYEGKTFIIMARKLFNVLRSRRSRFGVGYQKAENWQNPMLERSTFIANPPNRFLADPFVFRRGDLEVCFVEDYDFRTSKGSISVFKVNDNNYEELGTALDEPFHLSYPFIFTVDDELYMCPETGEIREIRLYRCTEFPLRWVLHKTLIKDISAVDTNIFFFGDRWWLLTTIDSSEIGEICSELHAFYSDAFDSETWTPHPKNPVIFDSERARSGGFFQDDEKLLRVFQKQGFDLYGQSMGIAEIKDLGVETYREEIVSTIAPNFAPKIIGTHTFSYYDGLLAIDFVKIERVKT